MNNMIEKIKTSYNNTLAAFQDYIIELKLLRFYKGNREVMRNIKDKVSLATALSWIIGRNKRKD